MCGLEGQGAGVRIDGCDENHVQIRFVPVGVPAGGFIVVIPAVNEIIAVRVAIQRPAFAGIAKGDGGTVCVVDVVTRKPCVIVVQLYIVREDCGAPVLNTTALRDITGVPNTIACVVALNAASIQVQSCIPAVENAASGVFFYLQVCTAFHGQLCVVIVENTECEVLACRDISGAGNDKLVTSVIGDAKRFVGVRNNSAFDFQLIGIVDTRVCVAAGGDCCTVFNHYVTEPIAIGEDVQTDVSVVIAVKFRTASDHAAVTNKKTGNAVVIVGVQNGSSVHVQLVNKRTTCSKFYAAFSAIVVCIQGGVFHFQLAIVAAEAALAIVVQGDVGIGQIKVDRIYGHAIPTGIRDCQSRGTDPDFMNLVFAVSVCVCIDTTATIGRKAINHSICIVFEIQITAIIQTNATAIESVWCQREFNMAQTELGGINQVGRCACVRGVCVRMDFQREILERDVTAIRCVHAQLLQRQRAGTAAGNGQVLLRIEAKTRIQLNVLQQVDLITIRRRSDCIVQCGVVVRIVDLVDLAHILGCGACGAVVVVRIRKVIATRFLVRSFGGEIPCGPVIRCFIAVRIRRVIVTRSLVKSFGGGIPCGQVIRCCFIAARVRRAFLRARLRKVGNRRFLFLQIIKGVGNGGKVTPVQNGAVRIRDGGVGAQCKYTQRQNMKQQSDGKYHYEPSLFHNFFSSSF